MADKMGSCKDFMFLVIPTLSEFLDPVLKTASKYRRWAWNCCVGSEKVAVNEAQQSFVSEQDFFFTIWHLLENTWKNSVTFLSLNKPKLE